MRPNSTKKELSKWYRDEYIKIASHPVKAVGEWSLVKVTSPYVHKPFRCRSDFYLSTYVLRKNKVMFGIYSPYSTNSESDPERQGSSWVGYNKTGKPVDIAGKYPLETFLTKVYNGEIYEGESGLTATDLYNRYKIPLSVLNKFGFVTIPMVGLNNYLYQKSAFDDDAYDMWRENLRKARKAGLKYNNKDKWE